MNWLGLGVAGAVAFVAYELFLKPKPLTPAPLPATTPTPGPQNPWHAPIPRGPVHHPADVAPLPPAQQGAYNAGYQYGAQAHPGSAWDQGMSGVHLDQSNEGAQYTQADTSSSWY